MTTMIEKLARAISGQDTAGWQALPDNDTQRLYGGGKWHDTGMTKADYLDDARACLTALLEPDEVMLDAAWHQAGESKEMRPRTHIRYKRYFTAMIRAALEEKA